MFPKFFASNAVLILLSLAAPAHADSVLLKCRDAAGAVTYTDGQCAEGSRAAAVVVPVAGATPAASMSAHAAAPGTATQWANRRVMPQKDSPDVAAIKAARAALAAGVAEPRQRYVTLAASSY